MDNGTEYFQYLQRRTKEATINIPLNLERHRQIESSEIAQNMISLLQSVKNDQLPIEVVAQALADHLSLLIMKGTTDELTAVWNRRGFEKIVEMMKSHAERTSEPLVIAMIDLDHFKQFNTNYGHAIGDEVLKKFSQIIGETLRVTDAVARLGGEEFAAVLSNTGEDGGMVALERLRQTIESELASKTEGVKIPEPITASIGYTVVRKEDDLRSILSRADSALYVAKGEWPSALATSGGRNKVIAWQSEFPVIKM